MLGDHVYDFIMIPVSGSGDGQFILLGMIDKMHLLFEYILSIILS